MHFQLLLVACLHYASVQSAPVNKKLSVGEIKFGVDARTWLYNYGYTSRFNRNVTFEDLNENIARMQAFAGLKVTGKLDTATLKQMTIPRCGKSDIFEKRSKRYIHQGTDWDRLFIKTGKNELKWTLKNAGRSLRYTTVLDIMRQAFKYWSDVTNVDFIEIPSSKVGRDYKEEDIEILVSFESFSHGDGYAFDGQGGTLAHAFYPLGNRGYSGDVHFDDSERYTSKSSQGRNLLWVATHELGHSLGLAHSNVREAVMYPWYTAYKPGFKLNYDDIVGIQTLYGSRVRTKTTATTTTRARTKPTTTTTKQPVVSYSRRCPNQGDVTAIYYSEPFRQFVAFTKTDKIYLLGYKSRIPVVKRTTYLPQSKISEKINAVLTADIDGETRTIYIAGSKYYVYKRGFTYISAHSIHNGAGPLRLNLPSYVRSINAAFTWQKNGKIYLFSGTQYWRYDNKKKAFDVGYPKQISNAWRQLPRQIDAAYSSTKTKETYFISGDQYYIYDDENIRVKRQFPVNTFLKCNNAQRSDGSMVVGGLSAGPLYDNP